MLRSVPLEVFPIINIANCSCQRDSRSFSLEESAVGGLFILVPLCLLLWSFVRSFFFCFLWLDFCRFGRSHGRRQCEGGDGHHDGQAQGARE